MEPGGIRYITYPSRSSAIHIWNIADVHYGSGACDKDRFLADVAKVRDDPASFWFGGGDYCDYISPADKKRWDPTCIDPSITVADLGSLGMAQARWIAEAFRPIRHKCLGMLLGNHEEKYMRAKEQQDLHAWMCRDLEVPNLGYAALVNVRFKRVPGPITLRSVAPRRIGGGESGWEVRFALHHGFSGAATPGGKLNTLVRWIQTVDADVYMLGHVHDQMARKQPILCSDRDCTKIQFRDRIGVITGAYLKTYAKGVSTYGEQRGYAPVNLGAVKVTIAPDKKELRGEV